MNPVATYDPGPRSLSWQDRTIWLTRSRGAILQACIEAPGRVISSDALHSRLWPNPEDEPGDSYNTLRTQICLLRRQLREAAAPVEIGTVSGRGIVCTQLVAIREECLVFVGPARVAVLKLLRSHPDRDAAFSVLASAHA
jgi:DNA-binding winged helix-turn-helix (wHTH) protein